MLEILVGGLFGYLMGSISVPYFWGKLKGIDLTKEGTKKLGASNAGRILGWHVMIIGGTADVFKGTVALLILWLLFDLLCQSPFFPVVIFVASLSILLGHIISFCRCMLYLRFPILASPHLAASLRRVRPEVIG